MGTVPARFRFAVKGSRFITHDRKLFDVEGPLADFVASAGPLLWQLPARSVWRPPPVRMMHPLGPGVSHGPT